MEDKVDELMARFMEKSHCNCAPGTCTGTFPGKMCRRFVVREIIDVCLTQRAADGATPWECPECQWVNNGKSVECVACGLPRR